MSETGGHLGADLGVVELTVALHAVFDTPRDRLIWDVGHQSYPHKILTVRREKIRSLHQKDGAINVYYLPYPIKLKTCGHATNWKSAKYIHEEYLIIGHTINPKSKRNKNSCIKRGIVVAHELGHMIHLNHTKGAGHLMGNRGGTKIPKKTQIEVRKNYKQYLENYLK